MADGLCLGEAVDDGVAIEKTIILNEKDYNNSELMAAAAVAATSTPCESNQNASVVVCENSFHYLNNSRDKLFDKLCAADEDDGAPGQAMKQPGFSLNSAGGGGVIGDEEDCRKKRCVDRYDSSESSDSGVAVLSCTDCSGSSTASSDITDPGSPFSTASNHSEDSGTSSQPATKMPAITQTAPHPPWPWSNSSNNNNNNNTSNNSNSTEECAPPPKRSIQIEKTVFPKRLKSNEDNTSSKQSPSCLTASSSSINNNNTNINNNNNNNKFNKSCLGTVSQPSPNNENSTSKSIKIKQVVKKIDQQQQGKQGKITEYFKSQIKLHVIKKDAAVSTDSPPQSPIRTVAVKEKPIITLVDKLNHINGVRKPQQRGQAVTAANASTPSPTKKPTTDNKNRKNHHHHVTVPRKILPAPSKMPENLNLNRHHHHHLANFPPTVTLTTVFPSNLTYLHTKTPKPPDVSSPPVAAAATNNIFVPQFATITNDKIAGTIPIINRTTPCLNVIHHSHPHHQPVQKLTATTLNNFNCVKLNATVVPIVKLNTLPSRLSIETAVPTVLTTNKHTKLLECATVIAPKLVEIRSVENVRKEKAASSTTATTPSPTAADSDSSGVGSLKDSLEVSVDEPVDKAIPQKSPILSQPKTIRFPPKQDPKEEAAKDAKAQQLESGVCKWAQCSAQFDTNGALLEHLQVKHVISQATQEQYVCLWLGCKVHGRTSCSRSWLERHVLAHAGTKPFRCIVDGCGQRFNSQLTLERHVNGHFTGDGTTTNSTKKTAEASTTKLFKRNGKKIRFRRQPWSARMFDFIDSGIMEGLQHKLLTITEERTLGQLHNAGNVVNVLSQVVARRVEPDGRVKFLVRWHPTNIVPDEWVLEKELVRTKSVSIPSLQPSAKDALNTRLFPPDKRNEKRRRKPISKQQT